MSKLLTVFGATGAQGGSVIRAVLADDILSKEYKIRGITRDVSKPAAQALAQKGVEVVAVSSSTCSRRFSPPILTPPLSRSISATSSHAIQ